MKNSTKRRIAKNLEIGKKQADTYLANRRGTISDNIERANERRMATKNDGLHGDSPDGRDLETVRE
ncbi:MAG TPA: hypothetical protein VF753_19715 [Terriglobales bacterium]